MLEDLYEEGADGYEGRRILNDNITASSSIRGNFSAEFSRLSSNSCWKNSSTDSEPWLQVKLQGLHILSGVVLQGCGNGLPGWVSEFTIQSKTADNPFVSHRDKTTGAEVLRGNINGACRELVTFDPWIYAETLRVIPVSWHDSVGLRFELLGCRESCDFSTGLTDRHALDIAITASSVLDDGHLPGDARIQPFGIQSTTRLGWKPDISQDTEPWIQITYLNRFNIKAVITQGCATTNSFLRSFTVSYSPNQNVDDETDVRTITDPISGNPMLFKGNSNPEHLVTNSVPYEIRTFLIRLNGMRWGGTGDPCMKFEVIGCRHEVCGEPLGVGKGILGEITSNHDNDACVPESYEVHGSSDIGPLTASSGSPAVIVNTLDITLPEEFSITGIITQGTAIPNRQPAWATKFTIEYAIEDEDGLSFNFRPYVDVSGVTKVFSANFDRVTPLTNEFNRPFPATKLRVHYYNDVVQSTNGPCIRYDLIGCKVSEKGFPCGQTQVNRRGYCMGTVASSEDDACSTLYHPESRRAVLSNPLVADVFRLNARRFMRPGYSHYLIGLVHILEQSATNSLAPFIWNDGTPLLDLNRFSEDVSFSNTTELCVTISFFNRFAWETFPCDTSIITAATLCQFDIDECLQDIHGCSHGCLNFPGEYACSCPDGMFLDPDHQTVCKSLCHVLDLHYAPNFRDACLQFYSEDTFGNASHRCLQSSGRLLRERELLPVARDLKGRLPFSSSWVLREDSVGNNCYVTKLSVSIGQVETRRKSCDAKNTFICLFGLDQVNFATLCELKETWTVSETNELIVAFDTGLNQQFKGFRATYKTSDIPGCDLRPREGNVELCRRTTCIFPQAFIASPNYPLPPNEQAICRWIITTSPGSYIVLTIHDLTIPNNPECNVEYLLLKSGSKDQRLCGPARKQQRAMSYTSNFNEIDIQFTSQEGIFLASYEERFFTSSTPLELDSDGDFECPDGWHLYDERCFALNRTDTSITWTEAESLCSAGSDYSSLASIKNKRDMNFLHNLLVDSITDQQSYYIGLYLSPRSKNFTWVDGSPFSYTDWYSRETMYLEFQPDGGGAEKCTAIEIRSIGVTNNWFDIPCGAKATNRFICSKEATRRASVTVNNTSVVLSKEFCPNGFSYLNKVCIRLLPVEASGRNVSVEFCPVGSEIMQHQFVFLNLRELQYYLAYIWKTRENKSRFGILVIQKNAVELLCFQRQRSGRFIVQDNSCSVNETFVLCGMDSMARDQSCTSRQFLCGSGECVNKVFVCDFVLDCKDGSDEMGCRNTSKTDEEYPACEMDEYKCDNKQCIPLDQRCNLQSDCTDFSDEVECVKRTLPIRSLSVLFLYASVTYALVSVEHSVQLSNFTAISQSNFQCYSGDWIPFQSFCDGHRDCPGKSFEDEPQTCNYLQSNFSCDSSTDFLCKNGNCIESAELCLMEYDKFGIIKGCRDVTHLQDCELFECADLSFKCPDAYCIPQHYRCDNKNDCPRGEDEASCENYSCQGAYKCRGSSNCVSQRDVCDGIVHCPNGDDELYCNKQCPDGCTCSGLSYRCDAVIWEPELASKIPKDVKQLEIIGTDITDLGNETFLSSSNLQLFHSDRFYYCCLLQGSSTLTECLPPQDEFSSCTDLIRSVIQKFLIGIMALSALSGNIIVILIRLISGKDSESKRMGETVQPMLIMNLAIADLLMGCYLFMIAIADVSYLGRYGLHSDDWQTSFACRFAGYLSTISSITSVLFLTIISIDRCHNVMYPLSQRRLREKSAVVVCLCVWVTTIFLSVLPAIVFEENYYGHTSVCLALPLTADRPIGWTYSFFLFIILNLIFFIVIAACYTIIFVIARRSKQFSVSLMNSDRKFNEEQLQIALKVSFLVISDFVCWMPIIIMGFLALTPRAVTGEVYAWTAIVILPINSAVNPHLYTFLIGRARTKKQTFSNRDIDNSGITPNPSPGQQRRKTLAHAESGDYPKWNGSDISHIFTTTSSFILRQSLQLGVLSPTFLSDRQILWDSTPLHFPPGSRIPGSPLQSEPAL
ncbi:hypothetical protein HOLleu_31512 [Holothuria leucospilota]|uniref:G-protein coupled receptor GRL101 n=1 Tax=Holothuria leucospilota TaxID=206669 RepID=A0A9Q0YTI0_HOLLE|nr:hypothetical protein HOLleu_31512 [Holothuria leucospilota]